MANNIIRPVATYGQGPLSQGSTKPTLKDVKPYEPYEPSGDALVENRMAGLLEKGSPYLQAAEQRALQTANKRGLLNTTMAAGAGTAAAIESALPIASQDAAAFHQARMAGYQGDINDWLAEQQYGRDVGMVGVQEAASSRLSAQEAGQVSNLSAQEAGQTSKLSTQQAGQVSNLSAQEAGQTSKLSTQQAGQSAALQSQVDTATKERLEIQTNAQQQLAAMNLSAQDKWNAGNQLTTLGSNAMVQIGNIQASDMSGPEKTAAIAGVEAYYHDRVDELVYLYGGTIDWTDSGGGTGDEDPGEVETAAGITMSLGDHSYTLGSDMQVYENDQPTGVFVGENHNFVDADGNSFGENYSWDDEGGISFGGTTGNWAK